MYNNVFDEVSKRFNFVTLINPLDSGGNEDYLEDGYHVNEQGFHKVFNIGYGNPISVRDYANLIASNLNKPLLAQSLPLPSNELMLTHSKSDLLNDYIKYKPECDIKDGILEMTNWYKSDNYE